jgi:ABC-2 type transport system permease protein
MEVILSAATPLELLSGKVLGVSAAALLQLGAVLLTAACAMLVQGQVAALVLGNAASLSLPSGLSPSLLVALAMFFVLGFLLYAVLFAAAGSLVSRQEDVSQMVTPMTLLVMIGYLVALYASLGTIQMDAPWVVALSWVPFLSPYLMLSRFSAGAVGPFEVALSALLLGGTIVLVAWVASRIYTAGVLLYGQKASLRLMWRAAREGR